MKTGYIGLAAIGAAFLAVQSAFAVDLTLAERRGVEAYQTKIYPEQLKTITAAAGAELAVEVDWPALAASGQPDRFVEEYYWTDVYFVPLATALKSVASDDMGKKAIQAKLKKIVITYNPATAPAANYANGLKFENETLTVNFAPFTNSSDIKPRAAAIQKLLESKL
jgi:hypothetical protein